MMILEEAKELAMRYMKMHGLTNYRFLFNRSIRNFGTCNNTLREITLSKVLVEMNDEERVLRTLLHEIAHALTPHHGHDNVWKRKCIEIGGDGIRCYSVKDTVCLPKRGITYVCPKCGDEIVKGNSRKMGACLSCCTKYNGGKYSAEFTFVRKELLN
jgi:predicted RNA-binding Zn-ribbon protein involved in translation (DUF1610 family)